MPASLTPSGPTERPRQLWTFHGGLHLPDQKAQSTSRPIGRAAIPPRLVLPLQQHIGSPPEILVAPGERVLKGQLIARPEGYVSAALHAPSSGRVIEVADHPIPHPSGLSAPCIVIETDGRDQWAQLPAALPDFEQREPATLRERVRWAGVVGLGGAAFPSSVKLNPGPKRIHTLVLNGAECEPYISCDDMLMRERPHQVLEGLRVLRHMLGAELCLIGVEDNKPDAVAALDAALNQSGVEGVELVVIPTRYPSGGEKQLIQVLTGVEVPSHGIPAQVGMVCHNVGTAVAVADAVIRGRPLISRIVTLTGPGMVRPQNREVLIGTPADALIAACGGYTGQVSGLILGGPMMGFSLCSDQVPLTKGANCLLATNPESSPDPGPPWACIRCGECATVCPVSLLPQQLYWYARAKDFDRVQDYDLFDCIECGCCAQVCPSQLPLVQYYRFAKTEIWALEEDKRKAEHARQRHEARVSRLERLERQRKARLRKRKEALDGGGGRDAQDPKKAAIEAAVKRVAAKKAAQAGASSGNQAGRRSAAEISDASRDADRTD